MASVWGHDLSYKPSPQGKSDAWVLIRKSVKITHVSDKERSDGVSAWMRFELEESPRKIKCAVSARRTQTKPKFLSQGVG